MRLDITCLSHLAYEEGLFQRPQHLMAQFVARGHRVRYMALVGRRKRAELKLAGLDRGLIQSGSVNSTAGSGEFVHLSFHPSVQYWRSLRQWLCSRAIRSNLPPAPGQSHDSRIIPVTMLYHPQLLGLAQQSGLMGGSRSPIVVYDIMDRFPAFHKGNLDTVSAEEALIGGLAKVVIAGGGSLQEAAVAIHRRLGRADGEPVRLPSAVDVSHFGRAMDETTEIDPALVDLRGPVAGYFGAIDERMDWSLIRQVAAALPQGHVVLTGPVLCTVPEGLPKNLILTGARPYGSLPGVLKRFDVALIPFVQSELTAHISPTKAPEYLAGGRPVVSVPIPDVERDWPDVISVGRNSSEFVDHVVRLAHGDPNPQYWSRAASRWPSWGQLAGEFVTLIYRSAGVL